MSIDELLRDALTREVEAVPAPTEAEWSAIAGRARRIERHQRRRRLAVVALGAAAVLLVGVIVVGLTRRSTDATDNLFVGDPTTTTPTAGGLAPAANVEATVPLPTNPAPGDILPPERWIAARQGRTDSELVVYLMGAQPGLCGADYAATVESRPDRVTITMTPVRDRQWTTAVCPYQGTRSLRRAFLVELPEPRAMRQLIDGVDPATPRTAESTNILQAPTALPQDLSPQTEWLDGAWSVCYASTSTLCSPRLIAGDTVATIQAPGLGSIIQELDLPVGDELASPLNERNGIDWLLQHWIWPDPATPPFVQVTIHGRPALIFDRPGSADRLGDTVVVWTEGTAPDIDNTAFALGVSKQMGLTGEQVVALAESMRPTG